MYQRLWYDDEDVDDEDVDDDEELTYVDGVPELPVEEGEAWGNWHSVPEHENMRPQGFGQWCPILFKLLVHKRRWEQPFPINILTTQL